MSPDSLDEVHDGDDAAGAVVRRDRDDGRARRARRRATGGRCTTTTTSRSNRNGTQDIFLNTPNQARVVRALRHRLDRAEGPARPDEVPHAKLGVPRRHDGARRARSRDVERRRRRLRLGRARRHPPRRRRRPAPTATRASRCPTAPDDNPWTRRGDDWRPLMDLDFITEQEMLRDTVRGRVRAPLRRSTSCARWRTTRSATRDELWKQLGELDLLGHARCPSEYGGSGMSMLDGVVVYEELGPGAGAVAALRELGDERGRARCAPAPTRSSDEWLPAIAPGDAIVTPAWLEPDRGFGPAGRAADAPTADGDGFVLDGAKRHVPFAARPTACSCWPAPTRRRRRSSSSTRTPRASTLTQQMTIASDTQYRVDFERRARRRRRDRSDRGRRLGARGTRTMHDGIVLLAAQAVGGARYALDDHRAVRQGPPPVRQAARRVPGDRALPRRRRHRGRRRRDARVRGGVGPRRGPRRSTRSPRWRSCSRARRSATSPRWPSRSSAASASPLEYDIQLYFRRAKQLQISWWDDRYLEELVAAQVLDAREVATT